MLFLMPLNHKVNLQQKYNSNDVMEVQKTWLGLTCTEFTSVPEKWRDVLSCRACRISPTNYIAEEMLCLVPHPLQSHQKFTTNIGNTPFSCKRVTQRYVKTELLMHADEADLRVWLQCKNSGDVNKLIFSPDTDIYHIGLPLLTTFPEHHIIIQLSRHTNEQARYQDMNHLLIALQNDPDLSLVPLEIQPQVLPSLCLHRV